jgi:hypothetical protein
MNLFWLNLRYRCHRLWMCKHERAFMDSLIFGENYSRANEFYGTSAIDLLIEHYTKQQKEREDGHRNS